MGNCCISTTSTNNTEKTGFRGDQMVNLEMTTAGKRRLKKTDTKQIQYCARIVSHLHQNETDNEGLPCRDAGCTSLNMCYKSGTNDVQNHQTDPIKSMNQNVDSGCDSSPKSQHKKLKMDQGSTLSTRDQKTNVTDRAAEDKDACPQKRTSEPPIPVRKSAQRATKPAHDSHSSQQPLMSTSTTEDENSEVDMYRGEEEIEKELQEKYPSQSEVSSVPSAAFGEGLSSVSDPEDLQTYSEREWKGNTTKSHRIREGYKAIAREFNLCRVRGDNYCALRATLFQILSQSKQIPAWLQGPDFSKGPKLTGPYEDLIKEWRFPFEIRESKVEVLKQCLMLLKEKWQETVQCKSPEERKHMCHKIFIGHEKQFWLLEALKFLMLKTAIQLHLNMVKGYDVPEFCWLLFARDSSKCPKTLLTNHLRQVGFSGGLEQVEMCLLGHSLQQTIKVYRLYKSDTEEFITYYPNEHREDWPHLCLLTEDDRHYNALVPKSQTPSKFDKHGRPKWKPPSSGQSSITTAL